MTNKFKFYKEDKRWYIDLPEYPGTKAELEMVCGANTLLDEININNESCVFVSFSNEKELKYKITKIKDDLENGGAWYWSEDFQFDLWLCEVSNWVFGEAPQVIYFEY